MSESGNKKEIIRIKVETLVTLRITFINEMNRRKNSTSTTQIQQGISKFVEKSKKPSAISASENTGKRNSTTSSTHNSNLKRTCQSSLSPSAEKPPQEKTSNETRPTKDNGK